MPAYSFRCPITGRDFQVEQPMATTTPYVRCPCHRLLAPKVLGGNLQFTYGREQFHDGPMTDGNTLRETERAWRDEFKQRHGHDAERKVA